MIRFVGGRHAGGRHKKGHKPPKNKNNGRIHYGELANAGKRARKIPLKK